MKRTRACVTAAAATALAASAAGIAASTVTAPLRGPAASQNDSQVAPLPAPSSDTAKTPDGYCYSRDRCYNYVTAYVYHTNEGASDLLKQAEPKLARNAWHSLEEIAVRSVNSDQTVEIGWTSQKTAGSTDSRVPARLFVYHWVNGKGTCYSSASDWCGFVSTSKTIRPMMEVGAGKLRLYSIHYSHGRWNLGYDHKTFGYFPERDWNGHYTQAGYVETFGEIAATSKRTCTQMGNGLGPENPKASEIADFKLYGSSYNTEQFLTTQPQTWSYKQTAAGFRLGGNGDC
jgi:Neprosin